MTKISLYPAISSPEGDDLLIGTDVLHLNETKNFRITDLFAIGLETSVSKLKIFDETLLGYGQMYLDNDTLVIKGAPTNTRNLLISSATGFMSFKKDASDAVLDASDITDSRTWSFPDQSGTVALETAASGTFQSQDGKTVTVVNGLITSIV